MKPKLSALAACLLTLAPLFAQTPEAFLRKAVGRVDVEPALEMLTTTGPGINTKALEVLSTVTLHAFLIEKPGDTLEAVEVFPGPGTVYYLEDLERWVWERSLRLGPLHLRAFLHFDRGASHAEGTVLFLNSESVHPVGDVSTAWLGLGVADGLSTFVARASVPYALEPLYPFANDTNLSTWKLSRTTHIPTANMVPLPFLLAWGDAAYNLRAYSEPDHLRRSGEFLIPSPILSPAEASAARNSERSAWSAFQSDRGAWTDPGYIFRESTNTGGSGDQPRLGKHPSLGATSPAIASGFASDRWRSIALWTEGRRKMFLDWPDVSSNAPRAAYYFMGLHWISRWHAGYARPGGSGGVWVPSFGDYRNKAGAEVTGYNLDHFRSRTPALAFYTADPALVWITAQIGRTWIVTQNEHSIPEGGYYGGGFESLRGWLRPLSTGMECAEVLRVYGGPYADLEAKLRHHVEVKLRQLVELHPRFARVPNRPDEQVPGHEGEPISETWHAGLGGDFCYSWHLLTGSTDALEVARTCQLLHVIGWRGSSVADLEMPKQALAADWSIGRGYLRDVLLNWQWSLLTIPGIEGVDQDRLGLIVQTIEARHPTLRTSKWGVGPWPGFVPSSAVPRRPWYVSPR